jgi:hypothetical protein
MTYAQQTCGSYPPWKCPTGHTRETSTPPNDGVEGQLTGPQGYEVMLTKTVRLDPTGLPRNHP